jgi:hypothetical protein
MNKARIEETLKQFGFGSIKEAQEYRKREFLRSELLYLIRNNSTEKWPNVVTKAISETKKVTDELFNPITDVHKVGKLYKQHWSGRQPDARFVIMELFLIMFKKGNDEFKDNALGNVEKNELHDKQFHDNMVLNGDGVTVNKNKEEVYNLNTEKIVRGIKETLKILISEPKSPVTGYMYLPLYGEDEAELKFGSEECDGDTLIAWLFELHNQQKRNVRIASVNRKLILKPPNGNGKTARASDDAKIIAIAARRKNNRGDGPRVAGTVNGGTHTTSKDVVIHSKRPAPPSKGGDSKRSAQLTLKMNNLKF